MNTRWGMRVWDRELSNGNSKSCAQFFYKLKTAKKKKRGKVYQFKESASLEDSCEFQMLSTEYINYIANKSSLPVRTIFVAFR